MSISRHRSTSDSSLPESGEEPTNANPMLDYIVDQVSAPQALQPSSAFHRRLSTIADAASSSGSTIASELRAIKKTLIFHNGRPRHGGGADATDAPELSPVQKTCLRGINRVEQILLDKDPEHDPIEKARRNNATLERFSNDSLGQAASNGFQSIALEDEWAKLSAPFAVLDTAESERSVRLRACQVLRDAVLNATNT